MQRPGQKRNRKRNRNNLVMTAFLACLFFTGTEVWAANQMVYKASRALKDTSLAVEEPQKPSNDQEASNLSEKTDPFKSFLSLQEEAKEKRKRERPKTYLETLDLSQLDLIATILDKKGNWAMVRDSKGVGHVIRKGTLIGTKEGVVREIREGAVLIQEKHRDFMGKVKIVDVVKKMSSDK